jgi:hypothetical protein
MPTIVDRIYQEYKDITSFLDAAGEISLRSAADETFRKSLLLAAASYFEKEITSHIIEYISTTTNNNVMLLAFIKNKALSRQYHTFFNWEANNANTFFGLFGEGFKVKMKTYIDSNESFESSIKDFLELGRDRNRLVHQDYGSFTLEKTADEIFNQYHNALFFVNELPTILNNS